MGTEPRMSCILASLPEITYLLSFSPFHFYFETGLPWTLSVQELPELCSLGRPWILILLFQSGKLLGWQAEFIFKLFKICLEELERWLGEIRTLVALSVDWVQFPTPTWQFKIVHIPVPENPLPSSGFHGHCMNVAHTHIWRHTYTQYKNKWICKYDWWLASVTYSSTSYCWEEKVAFFTLTVVQHSGNQITAMHEYISDVHKSAYFNTGMLHGAQQINTMHKYISYIDRGYLIKPELRCPNAQKELYLFSA